MPNPCSLLNILGRHGGATSYTCCVQYTVNFAKLLAGQLKNSDHSFFVTNIRGNKLNLSSRPLELLHPQDSTSDRVFFAVGSHPRIPPTSLRERGSTSKDDARLMSLQEIEGDTVSNPSNSTG